MFKYKSKAHTQVKLIDLDGAEDLRHDFTEMVQLLTSTNNAQRLTACANTTVESMQEVCALRKALLEARADTKDTALLAPLRERMKEACALVPAILAKHLENSSGAAAAEDMETVNSLGQEIMAIPHLCRDEDAMANLKKGLEVLSDVGHSFSNLLAAFTVVNSTALGPPIEAVMELIASMDDFSQKTAPAKFHGMWTKVWCTAVRDAAMPLHDTAAGMVKGLCGEMLEAAAEKMTVATDKLNMASGGGQVNDVTGIAARWDAEWDEFNKKKPSNLATFLQYFQKTLDKADVSFIEKATKSAAEA